MVTKYPQAAGAALNCDRAFRLRLLSFLVTFAVMASGVTSASFAASRIGGRYFTRLTGIENPPMVLIAIRCAGRHVRRVVVHDPFRAAHQAGEVTARGRDVRSVAVSTTAVPAWRSAPPTRPRRPSRRIRPCAGMSAALAALDDGTACSRASACRQERPTGGSPRAVWPSSAGRPCR